MGVVASPEGGTLACPTPEGSGAVSVLAFHQVREILARFDDLNAFDRKLAPSIWKVEHAALERPLLAYAMATKRDALFRRTEDRRIDVVASADDAAAIANEDGDVIELADWKEHVLGAY